MKRHASSMRVGVPILVAAVVLSVAAVGFASLPGPTRIHECPHCSARVSHSGMASYNTVGAVRWTDGFAWKPGGMHLRSPLVKCPTCRKPFWIADATTIDEIDPLDASDSNAAPAKVREVLDPDERDYMAAANTPGVSRDRELYARRHAWWLANEAVRFRSARRVAWTAARKQNLHRLSNLLDEREDAELLDKAEIGRALRQFDRCLDLLQQRPVAAQWADRVRMISELAKRRIAEVRPL